MSLLLHTHRPIVSGVICEGEDEGGNDECAAGEDPLPEDDPKDIVVSLYLGDEAETKKEPPEFETNAYVKCAVLINGTKAE